MLINPAFYFNKIEEKENLIFSPSLTLLKSYNPITTSISVLALSRAALGSILPSKAK